MICDHFTKVEFMRYEDFLKAEEAKNDREPEEVVVELVIDDPLLFQLWNHQLEQEHMTDGRD